MSAVYAFIAVFVYKDMRLKDVPLRVTGLKPI